MNFEPVIGLEVHAELLIIQMFCGRGGSTTAATVPGVHRAGETAVVNRRAVEFAIRVGLALTLINPSTSSPAKTTFTDLPRRQISYELPLATHAGF